jgi:trehalose/maltose hydrolase-like predicted phosphorylase
VHVLQVHAYWTEIPDALTVSSDVTEKTWIFFSSFDKEQIKARNSFQAALVLRDSTPDLLRQIHENAWADKWNSGRIDVEGEYLSMAITGYCDLGKVIACRANT